MQIGNADYGSCSCVRYVTSADSTDHMTSTDHRLAIGLAVGLALLLIIIIIIIIVVVVCRRHKAGEESIAYCNNGSIQLDKDSTHTDS